MKKYTNKHKRLLEYQVGDKILLKLILQIWKKLKNRAIHKSSMRMYKGQFEVLKKVENVAYCLKLMVAYKIHLTFHVSLLKSFH